MSCHTTGHKATRMSLKGFPASLLNQVQLNTLIPIPGNISEQHQLKCFAQFLFRFMQEHNSLSLLRLGPVINFLAMFEILTIMTAGHRLKRKICYDNNNFSDSAD